MRSGNGMPRRRSEKSSGKSTRLKRSLSHTSILNKVESMAPVVCIITRDRKTEINFRQRVEEALDRIHTFGRVKRGGGCCQA